MAMVCSCEAVAERHVRRAIVEGARSIDEVTAACTAGSTCLGCHDTIERLLDETLAKVSVRRGGPRWAV